MQLPARLLVLATALICGSVNVLALPYGFPFNARDAGYGMEVRDVGDEVLYVAREVPEWPLDARSLFDSKEYVAREFPPNGAPPESSVVEQPKKSKFREAWEKEEAERKREKANRKKARGGIGHFSSGN